MKKNTFLRILIPLLIVDALLIVAHIFLKTTLGFFDLDKEGNAKAVFSGMQLAVAAGATGWLAFLSKQFYTTINRWIPWAVTSAMFFLLVFEDVMGIHERVGFVINRWTNWHGAYESFNWLIYYSPFIILGALALLWCAHQLFVFGRRIGILAVCGYVGLVGNVVVEYVGGQLLKAGNIPWYLVSIIFEEGLLLVGESLFLVALLLAACALFDKVYERRVHAPKSVLQ